MKTEIIIQNGQARLKRPIYLKPDANAVYHVDVPSGDIEPTRDWFPEELEADIKSCAPKIPSARPGSLQESFNQILGEMARIRPLTSIGEDHQTLSKAIEERYYGR